jgi:restriction endonuclease Mrr
MAVPDYQSLMLPVLSAVGASKGEVRIGGVIGKICEQLELTAEDRAKLLIGRHEKLTP